jgi:hypothetical protein
MFTFIFMRLIESALEEVLLCTAMHYFPLLAALLFYLIHIIYVTSDIELVAGELYVFILHTIIMYDISHITSVQHAMGYNPTGIALPKSPRQSKTPSLTQRRIWV